MLIVLLLLVAVTPFGFPNIECASCHEIVHLLQETLKSPEVIGPGEELAIALCTIIEHYELCKGVVKLYGKGFTDGFASRFLDPDYFCFQLGACSQPSYYGVDLGTYTQEIMSDAPPVAPWPAPSGESFFVLQVTDIHADFFYVEGSSSNCDWPLCCRKGSGTAGKYGTLAACDVPEPTIEAFLEQAARMDIEFVAWTGDNPPHDVWAYAREKEMNVTRRLAGMFKKHLTQQVYPIIGNHDCFPMDFFNPGHEEVLLGEFSKAWAGWLEPEAIKEFVQNGYYSVLDKNSGLRVIGINDQLGDNFNAHIMKNITDPGGQLNWLRRTLLAAERAGEHAIILGHIPHGDIFSESVWARHYRVLVNRFQNIIVAQLFGHTHNDEFNLVRSVFPGQGAVGVLFVAPSMTTFSYHNPSFRLYEFDKQHKHLLNIHQYRLPLHTANSASASPLFEEAYDYKALYRMTDMSPASWEKLSLQVRDDPAVGQTFSDNFNSRYPFQSSGCDSECRKKIYCALQSDVFDENYACTEPSLQAMAYHALEICQGSEWEYINRT